MADQLSPLAAAVEIPQTYGVVPVAEARVRPSDAKATQTVESSWPLRRRRCRPMAVSQTGMVFGRTFLASIAPLGRKDPFGIHPLAKCIGGLLRLIFLIGVVDYPARRGPLDSRGRLPNRYPTALKHSPPRGSQQPTIGREDDGIGTVPVFLGSSEIAQGDLANLLAGGHVPQPDNGASSIRRGDHHRGHRHRPGQHRRGRHRPDVPGPDHLARRRQHRPADAGPRQRPPRPRHQRRHPRPDPPPGIPLRRHHHRPDPGQQNRRTATGLAFRKTHVRALRARHGIPGYQPPPRE